MSNADFAQQVDEVLSDLAQRLAQPSMAYEIATGKAPPHYALIAHLVVLSGQPMVDYFRAIRTMLVEKNRAYGNSALDPVRVFSKADSAEQIRVRLDDKLSRLARGSAGGEDVALDLMGYLVLLSIAERDAVSSHHEGDDVVITIPIRLEPRGHDGGPVQLTLPGMDWNPWRLVEREPGAAQDADRGLDA